MPSLDYVCTRAGGPPLAGAPGAASVPSELAAPLLKAEPAGAPPGALLGLASGARSALVRVGGVWYRLKGSGMHTLGFTVAHVPPLGSALPAGAAVRGRQVRGSAFPKEAVCELAMAARVGRTLARAGCVGANEPVAYAIYGEEHRPFGREFPIACIVERTVGDRRLGTHAQLGLRALLLLLLRGADGRASEPPTWSCATCTLENNFTALRCALCSDRKPAPGAGAGGGAPAAALPDDAPLRAAFPPARPREDGDAPEFRVQGSDVPISTERFFNDRYIAGAKYNAACAQGAEGTSVPNDDFLALPGQLWVMPRSAATLADLSAAPAAGARAFLAAVEVSGVAALACAAAPPPQWEAAPGGARKMDATWAAAWGAALRDAARALARLPPGASALAYLFARLGHDAGAALRALHDGGIVWGTYTDKLSAGTIHNNSHTNNFVVLPEGAHPVRLLGMLDLDMAFPAEAWVNQASGAVGLGAAPFRRLQSLEAACTAAAMAGWAPGGVPQNMLPAFLEAERAAGPFAPWAQSALADTMMLAFEAAYRGQQAVGGGAPPDVDAGLHAAAHAFLRLALILQAHYRA